MSIKIEDGEYIFFDKIVKKDIFCKKAQAYINNFLERYNLHIRSLYFSDIEKLTYKYIYRRAF